MKHKNLIQKQAGFTLIEIMVTVAILAVVVAFALPNYQDYMNRGRRADAAIALMKITAEQEKFYFDNNRYMDSATFAAEAPNWFNDFKSENGFYTVAVTSTDPTANYIATATPATGQPQVGDKDCTSLSINEAGRRTATGDDKDSCWR